MGIKKSLTFILGFVCATALFAAVAVFAQNTGLFYVKTQHRIPINLTIGFLDATGQQSNTNVALFVDIESTTTISNTTAILNNLAVAASARANDDTAISLVVGQPQQNFMGVIQPTPEPVQNTSAQNRPAPEQNIQSPATLPPATLPPATLPPATLPPATLPPATLPPTTLPPTTLPPTNMPVPPPTNTPVPPPINTQGPPPTSTIVPTQPPTTNRNANVRTGPGVTYEWMLTAPKGSVVEVIGINPERDWYALNNGGWVAIFLIDNVPSGLTIIAPSPTPTVPPTDTSNPPTATPIPPTATNTLVPPPTDTAVPTPLPTNTPPPPPTNTSEPVVDTPAPATPVPATPVPATPVSTEIPAEIATVVPTSLPTRLPLPTRESSRRPTQLRTPIPAATENDVVSRLPVVNTPDVEEEVEVEEIAEEIVEIIEDTPEPIPTIAEPTPEPTPTDIVLSSFQYLLDMPRIQVKLIAKDLDFDSLADDLLGQVGQVVYGSGEIVRYETVQDVEDGFYIDARVQADMLVELPGQNDERLWIYYTGQEDLEVGDTIEFWAFVYSRYRYYTEEGVEYLSPYLVELVTE